jgi:hypothetical protein
MAISANYPTPITVNGYQCWNCTDVANAKNHIDPAHPQDGPFGIDATGDTPGDPAVKLSGKLSPFGGPAPAAPTQTYQPGSLLNVAA